MSDFLIAGFGEVMLRICPQGKKRFSQSLPGSLEATFGGGEANVCASVAMLGGRSRYLTALPENPIARAFAAQLGDWGAMFPGSNILPADAWGSIMRNTDPICGGAM